MFHAAKFYLLGATVALVVVAAVVVTVLLRPQAAPAPQARQYLDASACLLTDPQGVSGAPGAPVWGAMESASLATHVMVSYFPDTGPGDVTSMINTLVQHRCGVIVATGAPAGAVISAAVANPHQQFLVVVSAGPALRTPPNAVVVAPAAAAARVDKAIHALAAQA
jgi:hypothetical protein